MEKKIGGGGGGKPAIRFGFSWADEVEREEREQQEQEQVVMQQQQQREAKTERQGRADPFGAARPREVVLAEKGVDWRARDRELDAAPLRRGRRHAAATPATRPRTAEAAPGRATVSASARRATPARRGMIIWDREAAGAGRTPHPQRHADSPPLPLMTGRRNAPPASHGTCGVGGKRKCSAGEASVRRVRPGAGQGRRVFGELNVGDGCGNSAGTERVEASQFAVADGGSRCSGDPATATTAVAEDGSAVDQKRRKGRKRGKGRGSKKTENQQTLLL